MYQYPPPQSYQQPAQSQPRPIRQSIRRFYPPLIFLLAVTLAAVAAAVYVLLDRLSNEVLTVIATIGCAAGVSLPGLLLAVFVLVKRAESDGSRKREVQPPQMTQPMITVIPPMALPQLPQPQQPTAPPPATWEHQPARHFTVVGEGEDRR